MSISIKYVGKSLILNLTAEIAQHKWKIVTQPYRLVPLSIQVSLWFLRDRKYSPVFLILSYSLQWVH